MEPKDSEVVERAVGKIATSIVIASGIIALTIYMQPGPPRFQAIEWGDRLVRVDTRSGTLIACDGNQCVRILRSGQHLERSFSLKIPVGESESQPAPAPAPRALPAPAAAPARAPAPTPAPTE